MICSNLYNTYLTDNNMIYSIDKIRLKTYIYYYEFSKIEGFIKNFHSDLIKKFWISDKINAFHYNYNIEIEDGKSFVFQFIHNSEGYSILNEKKKYNFTIEFNPNKLKDNSILLYILHSFSDWFLRSFDLAIDLPINILDILIDKKNKRSFKMFSSGGDNITYYIGSKEKDSSCKIYNKKKESKLDIVGYYTRIEISRKYDDFDIRGLKAFDFGDNFPLLYLNKYCFSFSDITSKDKTLYAILYAVQSGYPLSDLSRRYREKVESLLCLDSLISFNSSIATNCFIKCLLFYFCCNGSKQVIL